MRACVSIGTCWCKHMLRVSAHVSEQEYVCKCECECESES